MKQYSALLLSTLSSIGLLCLAPNAAAQENPVGTGCEIMNSNEQQQALLQSAPDFKNPPVFDFTSGDPLVVDIDVSYQYPVLAGCQTKLRQYHTNLYDGRAVGVSMMIKPGQTYQANITNNLPDDPATDLDVRMMGGEEFHEVQGSHGGNSTIFGYLAPEVTAVNHNQPGDFNVTNIHTHGWHVDPTANHDNIFEAIGPGDPTYLQQIYLDTDHVTGTFWYHAHLHGSTALQVASGMAGSLLVVDDRKGLDAVIEIAEAKDLVFILQQLAYDEDGVVESYDNLSQGPYGSLNRPVFINGQTYPVIEVMKNEVQRWRFVHAGMTNAIKPQLVTSLDSNAEIINLYEIALDGIPIDSLYPIQNATLNPGYRVDVLAQMTGNINVGDTLYLIDSGQNPTKTDSNGNSYPNMRYILAQLKVVDGTPSANSLPSDTQIAEAKRDFIYGSYQPGAPDPFSDMGPLNDITDEQITGKQQVVHYIASDQYICPEIGGTCSPCLDENGELTQCEGEVRYYMTCDGKDINNQWMCMNFNASATYTRTLELDTASKWQVSADPKTFQTNHVFHVHVNPFQVQRKFVDGSTGEVGDLWVWKDSLVTPSTTGNSPALLKSRYTKYTGAFVQHCHVLQHEDRGMMQTVEVRPAAEDILDMLRMTETADFEKIMRSQIRE